MTVPNLNAAEWRDHAAHAIDQVQAFGLSGPHALRVALVVWADLLDCAPAPLVASRGTVPTPTFEAMTRAASDRLLRDDLTIPSSGEPADLLHHLSAQVAALDQLCHELIGVDAPVDPNEDWRVQTPLGDRFLVPRQRPYRTASARSSERVELARRDLMRFHRILPTRIGALDVRLTWRDMAADWPEGLRLGGVLFPGLRFEAPNGEDDFHVAAIHCPDQATLINQHLAAGHRDRCAAAVFPELTIDPTMRDRLRARLRGRLLWAEPEDGRSYPSMIVAGSWHEPEGDHFVNVATVFDAYGEEVLQHEKFLTFRDQERRRERIRPGEVLNVLVTEQVLIAFGICLDYCERGQGGPYTELDVDYVLVPSCGHDRTMEGHIATSKDMKVRFRSRGFVVQQPYPDLDERAEGQPLGYVLPPQGNLDIRVDDTLEYAPWSTRVAD